MVSGVFWRRDGGDESGLCDLAGHSARLYRRLRENRRDCLWEAHELIDHSNQHVLHPSIPQRIHRLNPELGTFVTQFELVSERLSRNASNERHWMLTERRFMRRSSDVMEESWDRIESGMGPKRIWRFWSSEAVIPPRSPSCLPSRSPSRLPSKMPTRFPSKMPSRSPSDLPSMIPSRMPSERPCSMSF